MAIRFAAVPYVSPTHSTTNAQIDNGDARVVAVVGQQHPLAGAVLVSILVARLRLERDPPVDGQYGSGVPSPAVAAQQARNDSATATSVMRAHPFEVEEIAVRFRVSRAAAAMMLLASMQGQPMRAMAQGGFPNAGEPVIVGERGPEVFVPNVPGEIIPGPMSRLGALSGDLSRTPSLSAQLGYGDIPNAPPWGQLSPDQQWQYLRRQSEKQYPRDPMDFFNPQETPGRTLGHLVKPELWDLWMEGLPESTNVEDLRTPEQRALDDELLCKRNRNVPKKLVEFPPAEEKKQPEDPWTKFVRETQEKLKKEGKR
jgi:hypothetical protein